MATQREEIVVRAGFDNTALASGLRTSRQAVRDFATTIGRDILAAFSATAIIGQLDSIFNRVKAIQAGAEKTGFNVVDYQKLSSLASVQLPEGAERFDSAMTRLNVKIGEGAKELEKWGIHSRNAEQAMFEIADKMQKMTDPAERAAMAFDLMGKGGAAMVPFLERGAAALKSMSQARLGWTEQDMKNIEDAHRNLEDSKNLVQIMLGKGAAAIMQGAGLLGTLSAGGTGGNMAAPSQREVDALHEGLKIKKEWKKIDDDNLNYWAQVASREMELTEATVDAAEASKKKMEHDLESLKINKQAIGLRREEKSLYAEAARIDQESPTIGDLAGRRFTKKLDKLYGPGGRFDLGSGNGPFAGIAQQYELAQKQQLWDIIHGNAAFDASGSLIGGAAFRDKQRALSAHNLLGAAGLETPAMKMEDMNNHLKQIGDKMSELALLAGKEGIVIKDN